MAHLRKEQEGWDKVTATSGLTGDHERPTNIEDGAPLTSGTTEYRELVLMALDEETAKARDEYHAEQTKANSQQNMSQNLKDNIAGLGNTTNAELHGSITFD